MSVKPKLTSLPPAGESKFNSCLKYWEQKKYSKAESSINSLLTKFPNSGECICVKGLIDHSLGRKKEGYKTVQKGLKLKSDNSTGWKIMGLLAVDEKQFDVACDAFKKASKYDPENMTILKDLALTQIHLKDYAGLLETRKNLFKINNKFLKWWIMLSVAYHLNKDYTQALVFLNKYIEQFRAQQPTHKQAVKLGRSQLYMYKYRIMKEAGLWENILTDFVKDKQYVMDDIGSMEIKGEAELQLGKLDDAKKTYSVLLSLNPDCKDYLSAWQRACGLPSITDENKDLSDEDRSKLFNVYSDLIQVFPKSLLIQRIALNHIEEENAFKSTFSNFSKTYLQKSIPSLFSTMKRIYGNDKKVGYIEDVMIEFKNSLESSSKFPNEENIQPPSTLLWCLTYLAFHFDACGDSKKALKYIDSAIEHTPTIVELYLAKGRIYKHAGALGLAVEAIEQARRLDLADRYLNTKCAKYLFRNDELEKAYQVAEIFAIQNPEGEFNLHGFQCQWYAMERGDAFFRTGALAAAIEEYSYQLNHYVDFYKDFYDFHDFCFRSLTINSYVDMLHYFETNKSHQWYVHSAEMFTKIWLRVFDTNAHKTPIPDHIVKLVEEEKKNPIKKKRNFSDDEAYLPHGDVIMRERDPLTEAKKYVLELEEFAPKSAETHALAIQVFTRLADFAHATSSWVSLRDINPFHPYILYGAQLITSISEEATLHFKKLTKVENVTSFYESFLKDAEKQNVLSIQAVVFYLSFTGYDTFPLSSKTYSRDLRDFRSAFSFLKLAPNVPESIIQSFNDIVHQYFPYATCFK